MSKNTESKISVIEDVLTAIILFTFTKTKDIKNIWFAIIMSLENDLKETTMSTMPIVKSMLFLLKNIEVPKLHLNRHTVRWMLWCPRRAHRDCKTFWAFWKCSIKQIINTLSKLWTLQLSNLKDKWTCLASRTTCSVS